MLRYDSQHADCHTLISVGMMPDLSQAHLHVGLGEAAFVEPSVRHPWEVVASRSHALTYTRLHINTALPCSVYWRGAVHGQTFMASEVLTACSLPAAPSLALGRRACAPTQSVRALAVAEHMATAYNMIVVLASFFAVALANRRYYTAVEASRVAVLAARTEAALAERQKCLAAVERQTCAAIKKAVKRVRLEAAAEAAARATRQVDVVEKAAQAKLLEYRKAAAETIRRVEAEAMRQVAAAKAGAASSGMTKA